MKKLHTQKGFTLVELAIVMTIIGLLIGGILKGQELMMNARVTATVAQVKGIEAAITSFRDAYNAMPGDIAGGATNGASTRIPGCNLVCNNSNASTGDGIIGTVAWTATNPWITQSAALVTGATQTTILAETQLAWLHLLQSNLLGGTTNQALFATAAVAPAWGTTHPAGRIGGGFILGNAGGTNMPGDPTAGVHGLTGTIIALVPAPASTVTTVAAGAGVVSPGRAAQLDRKIDDGNPVSGAVQATGVVASCQGTAAVSAYAENITANNCLLAFRVQN